MGVERNTGAVLVENKKTAQLAFAIKTFDVQVGGKTSKVYREIVDRQLNKTFGKYPSLTAVKKDYNILGKVVR